MFPAHVLFERNRPKLKDGVSVPGSYVDYTVAVNEAKGLPV